MTLPFYFEVPSLLGFPLFKMVVSFSLDSTFFSFLDKQAIVFIIDLICLSSFSCLIFEIFSILKQNLQKHHKTYYIGPLHF